jgi:hypothetical protein
MGDRWLRWLTINRLPGLFTEMCNSLGSEVIS